MVRQPVCEACLAVFNRRKVTRPQLTLQQVIDARAIIGECSPTQQCGDVHALVNRPGGERSCRCGKVRQKMTPYPPDAIVRATCEVLGIPDTVLTGPSQQMLHAEARHTACYLLRKHTRLRLASIAQLVGRSDHTSAIHGIKKTEERIAESLQSANDLARIEKNLSENHVEHCQRQTNH